MKKRFLKWWNSDSSFIDIFVVVMIMIGMLLLFALQDLLY